MRNFIVPVILLGLLLSFSRQGNSQDTKKQITGTVKNAAGDPLPGVSVAVKGTKNSTTSDASGNYSISIPSSKSVLVFTYVGMAPQEQTAGNNNTINVSLSQDAASLQDVVVVGYGTRKKATLTGSVSSVDAKTFQDRGPISSPVAALQGQVPGLVVARSSAAPGREGWNLQIRGQTSVNGTEPLYIIDGIPVLTGGFQTRVNILQVFLFSISLSDRAGDCL